MRRDTLHLTLAFLGAVDADRVPELIAETRRQRVDPGRITLDRYGVFARQGIVWAGPSTRHAMLLQAYDDLWMCLERLGWQRPEQVFQPHVTLLRRAANLHAVPPAPPPVQWEYQGLVLVQSRPRNGIAHYETLARSAE